MMNTVNGNIITGPYRATKLWNNTVRAFYNGMPLGRHWRGLKQYENCFTASEAVVWLNDYLRINPNFGPDVSKEKTIKLLRKFLKCGLIVGARGNKIFAEDFQDNKELFRFGSQSPLKTLRTPVRPPLAPISTNVLANYGGSPILQRSVNQKPNIETSCRLYNNVQKENRCNEDKEGSFPAHNKEFVTEEDVNKAWSEVLMERMESISIQLGVGSTKRGPLLREKDVNPSWVRCNMGLISYLRDSKRKDLSSNELPRWVFSAMKSLVNWPNSADSVCNIPNYPGVEVDIFKVVRDYFLSIVVPLVPFELYDSIIRIYIGAEILDISQRTPSLKEASLQSNCIPIFSPTLPKTDSVEDLMLDISINGSGKCNVSQLKDRGYKDNSSYLRRNLANVSTNRSSSSTPIEFDAGNSRTPCSSKHYRCSSIPRSLKFNRLQNYTDFKDSFLYPDEGKALTIANAYAEENPTVNSAHRVTLKSLKNRNKQSQQNEHFRQCQSPNSDLVYNKVLRTEELDNYSLPPNSCFETAFTSDSPKTRIIPQKSVDTIHIRNCPRPSFNRPKSIAVCSLPFIDKERNASSCEDLGEFVNVKSPIISRDMNRSLSEGNLLKHNVHSDEFFDNGQSYSSSRLVQAVPQQSKLRKASNSKSSIAARVRDSIKRKKVKDYNSKTRKNTQNDENQYRTANEHISCSSINVDTAIVPLQSKCRGALVDRLRTKSGGYLNPSASSPLSSHESDYVNMNSLSTVMKQPRPIGTRSSSNSFDFEDTTEELHKNHWGNKFYSSISPDSASHHSDYSSMNGKSNSASFSSSNLSNNTSCNSLRRASRCKSATPDGCLSHSLASGASASASLYHSALSGFNENESPINSANLSSTSPAMTNLSSTYSNVTPPELPKRKPVMQLSISKSSTTDSTPMPEYENLADLYSKERRALSCSANELSDQWADRTPYGTVPPFFVGGIYRHYHSSPSKRLVGHRSRFASKKTTCSANLLGLLTKEGKAVCIEAIRLVLLTMEPGRKRKLHLLLKMMSRVATNDKLSLDQLHSTNRALMIRSFSRCILLSEKELNYDEILGQRIVTFMMDNHSEIFSTPQNLTVLVHRKLNTVDPNKKAFLANQNDGRKCPEYSNITYCHRVTPNTYRNQKLSGSQQFLFELLDQILDNPKLSEKERRKKIKEFKTHYPEIYHMKFPPGRGNDILIAGKKATGLKSLKKFASIKSLSRHRSLHI